MSSGTGDTAEGEGPGPSVGRERRPRGWVSLYALSFVLLLAAGAFLALAARDFLEDRTVLWGSVALSVASTVTAVVSLVAPRRR